MIAGAEVPRTETATMADAILFPVVGGVGSAARPLQRNGEGPDRACSTEPPGPLGTRQWHVRAGRAARRNSVLWTCTRHAG